MIKGFVKKVSKKKISRGSLGTVGIKHCLITFFLIFSLKQFNKVFAGNLCTFPATHYVQGEIYFRPRLSGEKDRKICLNGRPETGRRR
jgi:hypothetical protein